MAYYSLDKILKQKATYNVIFGRRSNGKTYAVLDKFLSDFFKKGKKFAIIRRWRDDIVQKNAEMFFSGLVSQNKINEYSVGEWDNISYYAGKFYLSKFDETLNKTVKSIEPIGYAFALTMTEHNKMATYPDVKNILFDEFLTRDTYLQNEFVLFMNTLSTIVRDRDDISIFMLGNTVNKSCPYWREMGLTDIDKMKIGDIRVYKYGESALTCAVEYSGGGGSKSNKYFAFNNPRLQMITGGAWEIDIYPHLPYKYKNSDVLLTYFIVFENNILQCEIIGGDESFTYIHLKTTALKYCDTDLIFTFEASPNMNYINSIKQGSPPIVRKIYSFFTSNKVFYQDNETGEIVRNYLNNCR